MIVNYSNWETKVLAFIKEKNQEILNFADVNCAANST